MAVVSTTLTSRIGQLSENKGETNMSKLELNDLHSTILLKILEDVRNCDGSYAEQTSENKLRIRVATNILNQMSHQNQVEHKTELSLNVRMDTVESNIKYMLDNGINTNIDRIDNLESLIGDLTTVFNKHSIGDDEV